MAEEIPSNADVPPFVKRTLIAFVACVGVGLLLELIGLPATALGEVLLGWIWFLMRVSRRLTVNWSGVATAVCCLAAFALGLHYFLRWFASQTRGASGTRRIWRPRWTGSLVGLVVLMFSAGISFVGVAHQTGWLLAKREPMLVQQLAMNWRARRFTDNDFKQIGRGASEYNDSFGDGTARSKSAVRQSWQTLILPYLGYWHLIDLSLPWDDPRNAPHFEELVPDYLNPQLGQVRDARGFGVSHIVGNIRVLERGIPPLEAVADGAANTILAGEVIGRFKPWGDPGNLRDPSAGLNASLDGFASPEQNGVQFVMCDGSARFITNDIDPRVLKALSTPNGRDR